MKVIKQLANQGNHATTYKRSTPDGSFEIVKVPNWINFSAEHEMSVVKRIQSSLPEFPHIPSFARLEPFNLNGHMVTSLVTEFVNGPTLSEAIIKGISCRQLESVIQQMQQVLTILYEACSFTHYDLHLGNIILRPTFKKFLTYSYTDRTVQIPTHGIIVCLIDFEF